MYAINFATQSLSQIIHLFSTFSFRLQTFLLSYPKKKKNFSSLYSIKKKIKKKYFFSSLLVHIYYYSSYSISPPSLPLYFLYYSLLY